MTNISGTVLSEEGFAIEGAIVTMCNHVAFTDSLGKFTLMHIPPGTMFMIIEHRDYNQYVQSLAIHDEQPDLVITMTRISTITSGS
jgi:hypothetical protein